MTNKEAIEILKFEKQRYPFECANSLAYDLAIKALEERPQGEWIENSDKLGLSYICPFCGHEITGIPQDLNYCCKCGANMRKGGAE